MVHTEDGRTLSSAGNWLDDVALPRRPNGDIEAVLHVPGLPLLKGRYTLSVFVLCDRAINLYAAAMHAVTFEVEQRDVQQGLVALPHTWRVDEGRR